MTRSCVRKAFERNLRNVETTVSHSVTLVASGLEHDSMTVRELGLERTIWYQDKESTQDTLQTDLSKQAFP